MDNQPKCFVPNCSKDVGVLFPKHQAAKKKWLKSLGLDHLIFKVDSKSFVCLDHFGEDDLAQPCGVPKSMIPKEPASKDDSDKTSGIGDSYRPTTRRTSYQAGFQKKIDHAVEIQALKREVMAKTYVNKSKQVTSNQAGSQTKIENLTKQVEQRKNNEERGDYDNMCRLCMSRVSETMQSIYNKLEGKYTIAHMITVCLNPLQISPTDKLSKFVCPKCLYSLKQYFKFHQNCLGMDAKQKELILIDQEYPSDEHYADSDNSEEYLHEERLSDYEENKENKDEQRSEKTNGHIFKRYSTDDENKPTDQNTHTKSEIDLKFDRVERELEKVLEGSMDTNIESGTISQIQEPDLDKRKVVDQTEISIDSDKSKIASSHEKSFQVQVKGKDDAIYTENIIIEMINDEELQPTPAIKLPITIKRINSDTPKWTAAKRKRKNSNSFSSFLNQNVSTIKKASNDEVVVFPKGIKVAVKERYSSPLGIYGCETVKYLFDTEFLMADGYLYEYWLAKDSVRNLHCVVARCPGVATQARLDHNTFSDEVEIVKAHDHASPDAVERKRQMFYNIMYTKMRQDRHFNFKLLYEQFCKMDQDVTDILPLRKVISEICKQGPIVQPPIMNSFDEFYDSIESDVFHKIHFTDHHVQFYQDRFETDDGGKAVVFANSQVVELYSYSKLMYVDASFHIESTDFPYKLVTVLVWVYESYHPILYAFVNRKSQELYKQIFSFLYNTLAPKLRPDEIVTDYEANLYYALGETYLESSIGGSMFYFTENLYKKICALNLSRELDLNSNFRNVYNMLLMLPLLPVNTILDGLHNIEVQAKELGLEDLTNELFEHVRNEWICNVTPEFFCVHRLENRINENIVAPFKKLRDLIMLSRNKNVKMLSISSIVHVIEKAIELEKFLRDVYSGPGKKTFSKDLSSSQKKIVLKAWEFIEDHPKININHFFLKVLGYIKCLENQLWIWGFYRYEGDTNDELINANNFSIVNQESEEAGIRQDAETLEEDTFETQEEQEEGGADENVIEEFYVEDCGAIRRVSKTSGKASLDEDSDEEKFAETQKSPHIKEEPAVFMEAVIDESGRVTLQKTTNNAHASSVDSNLIVHKVR